MTLVNVWSRDFAQHIARIVATITECKTGLTAVRDIEGAVIRPSEYVDGLILTVTGLTAEFREKILGGVCNGGVLTIEDQPAFAYAYTEAQWSDETLHIAAIPYITQLRRSCLPDWYVPDERFC